MVNPEPGAFFLIVEAVSKENGEGLQLQGRGLTASVLDSVIDATRGFIVGGKAMAFKGFTDRESVLRFSVRDAGGRVLGVEEWAYVERALGSTTIRDAL